MHSCKSQFSSSRFFQIFMLSGLLMSSFFNTASAAKANNDPMSFAILGALGSLGMACYQGGKAPCSLGLGIDTSKLSISFDQGEDVTLKHMRFAVGADWIEDFYESKNFEINGRWDFNFNYWKSDLSDPDEKEGFMIGITPVFHYTYKMGKIKPYLEMGGGPQLLSNIVVENEYKSTQFQFGSIFGAGLKNKHFELGYRYLHISNAGIEMPNPGTDFHNIHIGYKF